MRMRGCVVPGAFEPETLESIGLDVYPMRTCGPDDITVLVIPLTPESFQEWHKRVVVVLMNNPEGMYGQLALEILTALGITEES